MLLREQHRDSFGAGEQPSFPLQAACAGPSSATAASDRQLAEARSASLCSELKTALLRQALASSQVKRSAALPAGK